MSVPSTVDDGGFWGFYREYARSGIHAATAAGLTLFGLLTSYWIGFLVLAIAVYVLPLAHFYLAAARAGPGSSTEREGGSTVDQGTADRNDSSRTGTEGEAGTRSELAEREANVGVEPNPTPTADSEESATAASDPDPGPDRGSDRIGSDDGDGSAVTVSEHRFEGETDQPESGEEGNVQDDINEVDSTDDPADTSTPASSGGTDRTDRVEDERRSEVKESQPDREASDRRESAFVASDSPTEEPLYDAVMAAVPIAVGEDGVALARRDGEWTVVLERGPTVESNPLWGVDATSDGERVWFCGDSGVAGQYDIAEGRFTDRSAPKDLTSTWEDIAVAGPSGEERVFLVNGSGTVLRGTNDQSSTEWGETREPGSGSSIASIEFADRERGYCCDTNESVFETTDGGDSWEHVGIDEAGVDLNDLTIVRGELVVAGDDGSIFRHDDPGWTKLYAGEEALLGIGGESTNEDEGIGVAVGDSGVIYEAIGNDWEAIDSPTEETLCGVAIGSEHGAFDVAVGDSGTILERGSEN
jgi:photosystem II stability/assembly factor-like uncharacterized protein